MKIKPASPEAYKLFHEGILALSQIEANGIRIDMEYLKTMSESTDKKIRRLEKELHEMPEYGVWRKHFGKASINSHKQLGAVIFDLLGNKRGRMKKVKDAESRQKVLKESNDQSAFQHLKLPFLDKWFERQKLIKLRSPYISNILREVEEDGLMHPVFDLHIPTTYRGSSSKPNFQNYPVRNAEIAKLIRSCIIPRDGHLLVENDFGGIEVCIGACYHKDPLMIKYIKNGYDYHKEYAAKCYMIPDMPPEWWKVKPGKDIRYCGKNKFVFPSFYGQIYTDMAPALWEAIELLNLTYDGVGLYDHLKEQGIKTLGECEMGITAKKHTFERHVQKTAEALWALFKGYAKWKDDFYHLYRSRGWFELYTGFVCSGLLNKNDVTNWPIQGTAFHCLLWVLIQMQKWLRKYKMRSKILGQIHDCIVADVHAKELDDYLGMITWLVEEALPKHFKFIIVPMKIEAEIAPEGKSWHEKRSVELS